ncbi:MAG: 30S ribosomal protein S1 [Candidatus Neomarinimicrobiota bacterium]|nr:30S ribosomal protein S1 [Candidatus Neomarinimicrobiota bacterium]
MSDKVEQETIEEKIEGLADQDLNEKQNVLEEKDSDDSVQESVSEDNNDSEKEESVNKKPILDYLDPSILQVREISEDEIEAYASEDNISTDVSEKYLDTFSDIRQQEVVEGNVVGINDRDVLIDIGFKAEGVVSRSEFKELPEIGEKVDVFIRTFEDRRGNLLLSKEKADFQKRWQEIRDCFEEEKLITGLISRRIKGGMVVDLGVVQAFLPGSQLDIKPVTDFDEFLGVESEFKIVKFNELRQNIVLSRKAILEGDLKEKRQEVLEQMEVGMVLDGIIKNITDFGAFVDLGGVDGLLHITDITWGRINHPTEKLTLGDNVKVKVIDFDVEKIRVSLGMKQLQDDPWKNIMENYPVDSVVDGKIVSLMNYGVFVEIEEGVEGLIHISEMSWVKHIKHPSDIFNTGDKVTAKILNIDVEDKKISMGIKQLQDNPWDDIESKFSIGQDYEGVVQNLTQFGAFVELEDGIDGLVHVSDMSWTKLVRHPKDEVSKGDKVKVRVLELSVEEKRLSLGMKQVMDNPWEAINEKYPSGTVIDGKVIKILDKGIIFSLFDDIEGICPIKKANKSDRDKLFANYKEGDTYKVTVQQVDEESKKIILMLDDLNDSESLDSNNEETLPKEKEDKIEIPQEIIDSVADSDKDSDGE